MTTFTTSRPLAHGPAEVFAAIQDPSRLARWWGPAGFTNTFSAFEFRPGGRWTFVMHGPDGTDYPNESRFQDIVTDRRVVVRHTCAPFFTLAIDLEPTAGGTLLRWAQDFDDPGVAASVRHIVEPANEQNLDRLAVELAARTPS